MFLPRTIDTAVRSDFGDLFIHNTDIIGGQIFEVIDAWCWPTAAYPRLWDDHGFEFGILDFRFHFAFDVCTHLGLRFAVREKKAKGVVDPAFIFLAEFQQDSGRLHELFKFCLRIRSRWFRAEWFKNPGFLTNKVVYMSDG